MVVLCKQCHIKVHQDELIINGYIETDKGLILDIEQNQNKISKNNINLITHNYNNNITDNEENVNNVNTKSINIDNIVLF